MIPLSFLTLILFLFINPVIPQTNMPGKRNFSSYSQPQEQAESHTIMASRSNKKLRRLPHVFSKVLELPFKSDEDVFVEERHECFKFVANTNDGVVGGGGIHVVELHPGITKVVVRRRGSVSQLPSIDQLELDVWRFRLPTTACPELATVVYAGGQLVVTVPKNRRGGKNGEGVDCKPGFSDSMGRLITVQ